MKTEEKFIFEIKNKKELTELEETVKNRGDLESLPTFKESLAEFTLRTIDEAKWKIKQL